MSKLVHTTSFPRNQKQQCRNRVLEYVSQKKLLFHHYASSQTISPDASLKTNFEV